MHLKHQAQRYAARPERKSYEYHTAPTAIPYTIDPAHSSAGFKIRHLMIAYVRGGFGGVTGDVIFDPANPANIRINASINATTLNTLDERRDAHVKSAEFLDTEKYPTITFVSTRVAPNGDSRWKIAGEFDTTRRYQRGHSRGRKLRG
jgi:polyisoprenoid-binding protein YceI